MSVRYQIIAVEIAILLLLLVALQEKASVPKEPQKTSEKAEQPTKPHTEKQHHHQEQQPTSPNKSQHFYIH